MTTRVTQALAPLSRRLAESVSSRGGAVAVVLLSALLLVGCEGQVTVDMVTDAPANRSIQQVNASITGLEFLKDDGGTETLSFNDGQPVNLLDYLDGNALRLFTDEELPEGTYTGVRLTFEEDPADDPVVIDADGDSFPLTIAEGDYADLSFTIDEDESSEDAFTLTMDLRQSLIFNDDDDEYTLQPHLRSVEVGRSGEITGFVDITCPTGTALTDGGAVYLFTGQDVEPDDRDGAGVEPFATTDVFPTTDGRQAYGLRFLPEGDYTIALTCEGDLESPDTDDSDMDFERTDNVQVDEDRTVRVDFAD